MRCQGSRSLYGSTLPEQPLDEIASGYIHTCATTTEGRLRCWGLGNDRNRDEDAAGKDFDQSIPPDGIFHGLTTGAVYSCALDQTDEIHCWGEGFRPYVMHQPERQRALPGPDLPEGKFRAVAAGFEGGCALPRGPGIDCWGWGRAEAGWVAISAVDRLSRSPIGDAPTTSASALIHSSPPSSLLSGVSPVRPCRRITPTSRRDPLHRPRTSAEARRTDTPSPEARRTARSRRS